MSPLSPTLASETLDGIGQDAGGRLEVEGSNTPTDKALQAPSRRGVRTYIGRLGGAAQSPAVLSGPTTEAGPARTQAIMSMASAVRGKGPTLLPRVRVSAAQFRALQEWEGTVIERKLGALRVRLVDKTNGAVEEDALLNLEEVSPQDRGLVKPGAVFYWTIGYHDSETGQRTRQSVIAFRRLPAWTESELQAIRRRVRRRKALFGWPQ
jgi:hypothetical protein